MTPSEIAEASELAKEYMKRWPAYDPNHRDCDPLFWDLARLVEHQAQVIEQQAEEIDQWKESYRRDTHYYEGLSDEQDKHIAALEAELEKWKHYNRLANWTEQG